MLRLLPEPWVCQTTPPFLFHCGGAGCSDSRDYGFIDCVVLMVGGQLLLGLQLDDTLGVGFACLFKDDEIA